MKETQAEQQQEKLVDVIRNQKVIYSHQIVIFILKSSIMHRTSMRWVPKTCPLVALYKSSRKSSHSSRRRSNSSRTWSSSSRRRTSSWGKLRYRIQRGWRKSSKIFWRATVKGQDMPTHGQSRLVLNQFNSISEGINQLWREVSRGTFTHEILSLTTS